VKDSDKDNLPIKKRSIIIVGATGDIGGEVATYLYESGFNLILTYSSSTSINQEVLSDKDPSIHWYHLDVRDSESVSHFFGEMETAHGPPFALIYCAGIVRNVPLLLTTDEVWSEVLDVNLSGAFYCIRATVRSMMVAGSGRIILIGSVSAKIGQMGQASYSASKGGLESLCRVAALELGRYNVTCNVIAPGAIESRVFRDVDKRIVKRTLGVTPVRRLGKPREVASLVHYLLSDEASFITGQALVIDGGLSAI